jgi:hypothetical protein
MPTPRHATARIATLRDHLRSAVAVRTLGDATAAALASACDRWLNDEACAVTLDRAFGVQPEAGHGDPREDLRRERWNGLLCEAAHRLDGDSLSARACELHRLLSRYSASPRWRQDRIAARCPYEPGTMDALLYEILRLRPIVLSERRLREIVSLATKGGLLVASDLRDMGKAKRSESETGATHGFVETGVGIGGRSGAGSGGAVACRAGAAAVAAPTHRPSAPRRRRA